MEGRLKQDGRDQRGFAAFEFEWTLFFFFFFLFYLSRCCVATVEKRALASPGGNGGGLDYRAPFFLFFSARHMKGRRFWLARLRWRCSRWGISALTFLARRDSIGVPRASRGNTLRRRIGFNWSFFWFLSGSLFGW